MESSKEIDELHDHFRRLAATDPKQALDELRRLLDALDPRLDQLLARFSSRPESRLRQLVANLARTQQDKTPLISFLRQWVSVETDEFTLGAIHAALAGAEVATTAEVPTGDVVEIPPTYRYVADRLCHQVRNALGSPQTQLVKLRGLLNQLSEGTLRQEAQVIRDKLDEGFRRLSRLVEFDTSDEFFEERPIVIYQWIKDMHDRYRQIRVVVELDFETDDTLHDTSILASSYWLDVIFTNLWNNAVQAMETEDALCRITIRMSVTDSQLKLLTLDNGLGFRPDVVDIVFKMYVPPKDVSHRGRGLLEVADAMRQLGGRAQLTEVTPGDHRVELLFPLAMK